METDEYTNRDEYTRRLLKAEEFNKKLEELSSGNLFAKLIVTANPASVMLHDNDKKDLFRVPLDTPPIACVNAWRAMIHQNNIAYRHGREEAFRQLRELIGVPE